MKILIVEDNPINYRMLQSLLAAYGEVEVAVNGKTGLAAFELAYQKNDPIDLIFLDIIMPEMDGHELLRMVRKYEHDRGIKTEKDQVAVVMSTSQERTESVITSFELGAHHYFLKPYGKEELEDLMDIMGFKKLAKA